MEPPECPVCLQTFDNEFTIPRVLGCGHSVCESCLIYLPKPPIPRTVRCPVCTQLINYPHPPSSLPKNIDLLRFQSIPNPKPKPEPEPVDFIPNLWSHQFFYKWKNWIIHQDAISFDENGSWMKRNQMVSLFKVASFNHSNEIENRLFNCSYLAKVMWVLFKMGDGELAELELILTSSSIAYRICTACGLWFNHEDDGLYLVCETKQGSLLNLDNDIIQVGDMSSFGSIGMEFCEIVSGLHDVELVTGCASLSCFGVDDFGHFFIDLNQVLTIRGRVREMMIKEGESFAQSDDIISEFVFASPELLIVFVRKEGVDLEFAKSTCEVGCGSDLWWLGCILLRFLLGRTFVEEMRDFLSSYILKLVDGNASDCEGLHVAWLDKVSRLLDSKLDSKYVRMKELLCKCLCHDVGDRPLVNDIWKCMRELIFDSKYDVIVSTERKTASGSICHCLLLGDLLWSSVKTNKVDDEMGLTNNVKDEISLVRRDVIDGVCKNSLTCTDLKGHVDCISGLAIGGGFLFSSSFDKTINVWSLESLNHVRTLKGHEHKVMALVFVESEVPLCISGDNGGEIFIWGIVDDKPVRRLSEEKDWRYSGIHAVAAVSGSDFFYTGSGDKTVKAWSMHDYSLSCTMNGHKSVVCTLAVCNGVLYSGSWDGTIRLWCLSDHSPLAVFGEDTFTCGSVLSLAAHTNTLAAAHENGRIKIWNKDVPLEPPISTHSSSIFSIYMEGQWLFSGGWNKTVVVQKLSFGDESQVDVTEIGSIAGDSVVTALHYSQGRLFVGHANRTIKIYSYGG